VAAAVKGQSEISVGNVLGSNVFNLGLVVGTAFTICPSQVPVFVITQDLLLLVVASIFVGVVVLRDARISRMEGGGMLLLFASYLVFIIVRGS
jgi:cation:H+ antiporter